MQQSGDTVRVGRVPIPFSAAEQWVQEYTDAATNKTSAHPYAYPAYDHFDGGSTAPDHLTDADLLAPGLLNVPVSIRGYYGLQAIRPRLEAALASEELAQPLAGLDDDSITDLVAPLYSVLDDPAHKPWRVRGTTLSKILHRKRPQSLVLHDRWVRACYVGDDAPIPSVDKRTWADYMVDLSQAIAADIRSQPQAFEALDRATHSPGSLSAVRLLDILAWKSQGSAPAVESDEQGPA